LPLPNITMCVTFLLKYLPLAGAVVVPFITLWLFPGVRSWDIHTFAGWMKCLGAADGPPYSPCLPDPINYPSVGLYLSAGVMLFLQKLGCAPQEISVFYQRFLAGIDSLNLLAFYLLLRGLGIRWAAWWTLIFSFLPSTRAGASLWVQIDSVTQLFMTLAFLCALRGLTAVDRSAFGRAQRYLFGLGVMISCAMLPKQLAVFALPPLLIVLMLLGYRLARRARAWKVVLNLAGLLILMVVLDQSFPAPPGNFGSGFFYALTSGSNHAGILSAHGANLFSLLPGDPARSSLTPIHLFSFRGLTMYGIPLFLGIGWFVGLSAVFFLCGLRLAWANRPLSPRGHILYTLTFAAFLSVLMNTVLAGTHERYMYHYGFFVFPVLLSLVSISRAYGQILIVSTFHLMTYGLFVYQILRQSEAIFPHVVVHQTLVFLNVASVLYMLVAVAIAAWSPAKFSFSLEMRDRCRMSSREIFAEACRSFRQALSRFLRGWVLICAITFIPYFIHWTLNIQPLFSADLSRLILWGLIAAIPYALVPLWQLPLLALALPLTALGVCEIFHAIMFRGRISVATVFVAVQTNWREVSEFTQVYFTAPVILGMVSYLVVVFLLWRGLIARRSTPRRRAIIACLAYLACVFVALRGMAQPVIEPPGEDAREENVKSVWPELLGPFNDIFQALDQYKSEMRAYRREARKRKKGVVDLQATATSTSSREVHVVVVGESTNRNHMQLYGYRRETTPQLYAMKDSLFVFSDVISTFSHTLEAVKSALTFAGADKDKKLHQVYSIIDVARKAGFRTYWISNQPPIGIWDNEISVLAKTADEFIFVNRTGESVAACDTHSPDERVLEPLDIALNSSAHKNILIVVHLMGTHSQYHFRYPQRFNVFTDPLSVPKKDRPHLDEYQRKTINTYDNAVLYGDWIVSRILESVHAASQSSHSISSMVYFSDHGEEVFESRAYIGHGWDNLGRHHFEIPFIVWLSQEFERARPQTVDAIKANITKPFMTSSFIYALIDLMGIKTPLQRPQQSLFSPMYQPGSRVVYNVDYDLRLRQKP
jgi:heptose-I-phosphate ethanolaminephosphotransferase